jgi:hypothetical protein
VKRQPAGESELTEKDKSKNSSASGGDELSAGTILVAFEKLFGGGRGVAKFPRSNLRYVNLKGGAILVEQNPKKNSEWAELASQGHRVAWVMCEGQYLARIVDGEIVKLVNSE